MEALAGAIVIGVAAICAACFACFEWGANRNEQRWLRLVAQRTEAASEALAAPPAADPLREL